MIFVQNIRDSFSFSIALSIWSIFLCFQRRPFSDLFHRERCLFRTKCNLFSQLNQADQRNSHLFVVSSFLFPFLCLKKWFRFLCFLVWGFKEAHIRFLFQDFWSDINQTEEVFYWQITFSLTLFPGSCNIK